MRASEIIELDSSLKPIHIGVSIQAWSTVMHESIIWRRAKLLFVLYSMPM